MDNTTLQDLLLTFTKNLNILQQRKAGQSGSESLALLNQIGDYETAIDLVQQALRGNISEAEMEAELAPLNLDLGGGSTVINIVHNYASPDPQTAPYQALPLPAHFVARADLAPIKTALLSPNGGTLALTALHGMGGLGKTTAAVGLAHEQAVIAHFADGVLWATLGPTANAGVIESWQATWGRALGDDLRSYPDLATKATRLRELLAQKCCLLIIDDAWPKTNLNPLLVGGPACRTLVTTRHGKIAQRYGASTISLDVLSENDALELLYKWWGRKPSPDEETASRNPSQREGNVTSSPLRGELEGGEIANNEINNDSKDKTISPSPTLTGTRNPSLREGDSATELTHRLGHLPLAISLAGAQLADGATLPELLAAFRGRQGNLSALDLEDPDTKRDSLTLAFDLSFERLSPADQRRFAQLGVFVANEPFDAAAAAAVWGEKPSPNPSQREGDSLPPLPEGEGRGEGQTASKHLRLLARHALLNKAPTETPHPSAFILHPLLRDYARTHLPPDTHTPAAKAHTAHYLSIAQNSEDDWRTAEAALGQIRTAWDREVSEAERRASEGQVFDFIYAMWVFLERRGLWGQWLDWTQTGLKLAVDLNNRKKEASMLSHIGYICRLLGQWDEALEYYQQALVIDKEQDDKFEIGIKLSNIGGIYRKRGDLDAALDHYKQALDIGHKMDDKAAVAIRLNNIGRIYQALRNFDAALDHYQKALDIDCEIDNKAQTAINLNNIGWIHQVHGDLDTALDHYRQALEIQQNLGDKAGVAIDLNNIGRIYQDRGDLDAALNHFRQALNIGREMGNKYAIAIRLTNIGTVYVEQKRFAEAETVLAESVALFEQLGSPNADIAREWLERARQGNYG